MLNRKINLHLHIVLFGIIVLLNACTSFKDLEIGEVTSFKVNNISSNPMQIRADIEIKNPNNYKVKIKEIKADILLNNKKITDILLNKKVVLPRKSNTPQPFIFDIDVKSIINAAPSIVFGKSATVTFKGEIKGKVFIFSKIIPLEMERKITSDDFKF